MSDRMTWRGKPRKTPPLKPAFGSYRYESSCSAILRVERLQQPVAYAPDRVQRLFRIQSQSDVASRSDQTWPLPERERGQSKGTSQQPQPPDDPLLAYRLTSTTTKFQVTSSRRIGTSTTHRAHAG